MASVLQTELITNNKSLVIYDLVANFPTIGSEYHIFYVKGTNTSYKWDTITSEYVILSSTATDLLFYDNLASFPVTGNSISLYVANDTNYIYSWTDGIYQYEKSITSEALMFIEGTYVAYSSPASAPKNISPHKPYRILSDNGKPYVIGNDGNKTYFDINMMMVYFKPIDRTWEDILGTAILPPPIDYSLAEGVTSQAVINSIKLIFDTNNDGIMDRAKTADALGGVSASYYLSEINKKANQTDLNITNNNVALKANQTDVDTLETNLATTDSNVDKRVKKDGDLMTGNLDMTNESAILFGNRFKIRRNISQDSLDIEII